MVKSYQAYKDSCMGLARKHHARGNLATWSMHLKIIDAKRGLERLKRKAWSIAEFILLQK